MQEAPLALQKVFSYDYGPGYYCCTAHDFRQREKEEMATVET